MVKRIFKILAIVLAAFVVISGAIIGITALRGGFKEKVIEISEIYFGTDHNNTSIQMKIMEDDSVNFSFEPLNATNKTIKVKVSGNENGIISNLTTETDGNIYLKAGEDIPLKVGKDSFGNNIGGVVTLTASTGVISEATVKIIVDTAIPDDSIFFSGKAIGKDTGKITTTGKEFSMAISENTQHVYLRSSLVNAFNLVANNENLKGVQVGYTYYKKDGSLYETKTFAENELQLIEHKDEESGGIVYYYKIPVVTDEAGAVQIWAKTHRTSEIEEEFKAKGLDKVLSTLEAPNVNVGDKELMLSEYNGFINDFIKYFDTTNESYDFFKNRLNNQGKVNLTDANQVRESLKYVFVNCSATINVSAIRLEDFKSNLTQPKVYNVFDSKLYSSQGNNANKIMDEFELEIKTDNETASGSDDEKDYMFESLAVKSYLYLDNELNGIEYEFDLEQETIKWQSRVYEKIIEVYGFEGNAPIIESYEEFTTPIGYLIELVNKDEFINITQVDVNGEKCWSIDCNVPLANDYKLAQLSQKALYVGFEVSGIGKESGTKVVKKAFTRVYIDYTDYEFINQVDNLAISEMKPYMSINSVLQVNASSEYYGNITVGSKQNVSVELDGYVSNLDDVSYSNVMYFVESTSNIIDENDSYKVATIGKYNFVSYSQASRVDLETVNKYKYGEEDLVGLRIPTYEMKTDSSGNSVKQYYLHALNASTEPVRVFAAVYLSDKNGNPIDVNGRPIQINETVEGEEIPCLVVIRISEVRQERMPEVRITSFLENMNFYTDSVDSKDFDNATVDSGFIARNLVNYYYDNDSALVEEKTLEKIKDYLEIKFLKDNNFKLYLSPFELSKDGKSIHENQVRVVEKELTLLDIYGENSRYEKIYNINTYDNMQYAFNLLCSDFNNYNLYTGGEKLGVGVIKREIQNESCETWKNQDGENALRIEFTLNSVATTNANSSDNAIIYLDPTASEIPYSSNLIFRDSSSGSSIENQIQRENYVVFNTYKLEIFDVVIGEAVKMQNDIIAQYDAIGSDKSKVGQMKFVESISDSATRDYYLENLDSNGNIPYIVRTNLIDINDNINFDYVDCSQANKGEAGHTHSSNNREYESIYEYINFYTKNTTNARISYSTASDKQNNPLIVSFANDYTFTNHGPSNPYATDQIYFGNSTYPVEDINGYSGKVNINGYELDVTSSLDPESGNTIWALTIEQGSYFPRINIGKDQYALIYNEMFKIDYTNESGYQISEYETSQDEKGKPIKLLLSASIELADGSRTVYNPTTYLGADRSNDSDVSAIELTEDKLRAKVKFKQGEELANKKGVKVHLLITFPFMTTNEASAQYTFYRAIEYNILQEEVNIVTYNDASTATSAINSNKNPIKVQGGSELKVYCGESDGSHAHISTDRVKGDHFFEHVTFTLSSGELVFEEGALDTTNISLTSSPYFTLQIPNIINTSTFSIKLGYTFKGHESESLIFVEASPNIKFTLKDNSGIDDINDVYNISLKSSNSPYNIMEKMSEFFEFNTTDNQIKDIKLIGQGVNGNKLTISDSYAEFDGNKINYEYREYEIKLILEGNGELELNYKLRIKVIPTYVIDMTQAQVEGGIKIFNGDNLLYKYIRLYNGDITLNDIKEVNNVLSLDNDGYKIFTITPQDNNSQVVVSNGIVSLEDGTIPNVDTLVQLKVSYPGLNTPHVIDVTIRGVEFTYVYDGSNDVLGDNDYLLVEAESGATIDLEDIVTCSLTDTTASDVAVVAVLVDENGNMFTRLDNVTEGATYTIGYARTKSGSGLESGIELVERTNITLEVLIVDNLPVE